MKRKMETRFLSLLMAAVMLLSSAVPAMALDAPMDVTNATRYDDTLSDESSTDEHIDVSSDGDHSTESTSSESSFEDDIQAPIQPEEETPPIKDSGAVLPKEDALLPDNQFALGASGLDPPDGFTFEAYRNGHSPLLRSAAGSTTITMETNVNRLRNSISN